MRIHQFAPLAQSTQRALTEYEVSLSGVGKRKPPRAPPDKQQIEILFKAGDRPAYRRDWEMETGGRGAERPRLSNSNEYVYTIEVGSSAHAQGGCAF